ncbi:MAG: LCP family protein [Caldilineaceae bacterium]|nr:LCP family protein [Caldilineaceae bacterium]
MSRTHPLRRRRATRKPQQIEAGVALPPQTERGCRSAGLALLLLLVLLPLLAAAFLWLAPGQSAQTFLIAGIDQRPDETGPARADVIVIMQIDPGVNRVALMSVPRDLWLPQPDGVTNRVNTALVRGYRASDPEAGPRYLAQTLAANFGLPLNGYFILNFEAFVDVVNAVGGIDVDVPAPIVDTAYPTEDYGVQTIRFETGPQHMDGERALIYVRTRHQDSDFGRAARQQQLIRAVAEKIRSPLNWIRIPAVMIAIGRNVQSDVPLTQWPILGRAASILAAGDVDTLILDQNYVQPWTTESGAAVLLPRWDAINPALQRLFTVGRRN